MKKIEIFPYIWKENPSVDYILSKFLPTLKNKVFWILEKKSQSFNSNFEISSLPTNEDNIGNDILLLKKRELILNLEKLLEINDWKKPINILIDNCFTNYLLIDLLKNIFWIFFDKFIEITSIDYENFSQEDLLKERISNNSIILIWWSFLDTYSIPDNMYQWYLANLIREISKDQVDLEKYNNKILWVCFWQQYVANLMWIERVYTEKIITTIKWPAQFWYMPMELSWNIWNFPYMYQEILNGLTNYWNNKNISSTFTRTWYVDFNLLNSYTINSDSIINLMKDTITNWVVLWGSKNWNILWSQSHFEIDILKDNRILTEQIENLSSLLKNWYWDDIVKIIWNVTNNNPIKHSLWETFYTYALNEFSKSLLSRFNFVKNKTHGLDSCNIMYYENFAQRIEDFIINKNIHWDSNNWTEDFFTREWISRESYLKELEKQKKLKMLTIFDWKINREEKQVWETLWLKDLLVLVQKHKKFISWLKSWNNNYIFRDFWAWNGALVKKIDHLEWINWYWVWDFAYFDLYQWIKKRKVLADIPEEVKKIFIQELIEHLDLNNENTIIENIKKAINLIDFNRTKISNSSMFSSDTKMFNEETIIDNETKDWIIHNFERIDFLKNDLIDNFYEYIEWYFEKLLISDFNSLYIKDDSIKRVDFQTAIRSTSHIDAPQLESTLKDYVEFYSKDGSIYFDNWVIRSYTSVPRIKEYFNLEKKYKNIKVYFTYDTKTNYISSAVILKEPFISREILEKELMEWFILLDAKELNDNSFFRIERFVRELIIVCFKNYKIFYNKNKEIVEFLKFLSNSIKSFDSKKINIKKILLIFINKLINDINKEYDEKYNKITEQDLDFYISKIDEDMKRVLEWDIITQDWFNINFERK